MELVLALLVGLALGAVVAVAVCRQLGTARAAGVSAERDLLRERVIDLEAALSDDAQTAAALVPLRDALGRVEQQVGTLERDRTHQYAALEQTIAQVHASTSALGRQTQSLAGSLNASTVRGAWGEVQLRRVLEHAGLLSRCDFEEQVHRVSRHDRQVRPDVVVRLPGQKFLVVDAKAPMVSFLKAQADDLPADERARLLREHATALQGHVRALAAKDYWSAFETSPEMVVCFVPSEAMLSAALAADPSLHEDAMARRVVLVGPGALMALLRTVAFTWQQDALTANARELMSVGRELYARLGTLGAHTARMGGALQRSVEAYNQMVGALESRVLVTARRMHELQVVEDELPVARPVETGPRVLTAVELLDAATAEDARPQLDLSPESLGRAPEVLGDDGTPRWTGRESTA
ncbi:MULTISPECIES: DNA recombination protein RmuC [unclassified Phycicoccus]|uniref:DNA recombination protein RmuC n=1 Tax=unclassified Phycicoccus TaxID=2637926 RepID=UPI000702A150|nr:MULTISPECIES: DNA recombination protein RmuC [unclassified Phycicoccus]KQU71077.1 DNA polymerase V [Phycicoccus sp. Root101]KQZ90994.1 DNA polymerase V [Phycicoccus sp. Root563]